MFICHLPIMLTTLECSMKLRWNNALNEQALRVKIITLVRLSLLHQIWVVVDGTQEAVPWIAAVVVLV